MRYLVLAGLFFLGLGCGPAYYSPSPWNSDVLTAAEIEAKQAFDGDALLAIQRLRPLFIKSRGLSPGEGEAAIVDGTVLGDLSWLQFMNVGDIATARYLSAPDAFTSYGSRCNCPNGAIMIETKRGNEPEHQ